MSDDYVYTVLRHRDYELRCLRSWALKDVKDDADVMLNGRSFQRFAPE